MRRKHQTVTAIFIILSILFVAALQQETGHAASETVYVAPNGSDDHNGTEKHPFKSIIKARNALRETHASETGKIVLRGGDYYEAYIELESVDSGLTIEAYPGEQPILYGGKRLENWQKEGRFFTRTLDGIENREWDIHLLVVDNESKPRARLPETGAFTHLSKTFRVRWLSTSGGGWEIDPSHEQLTTMKYNPKDIGPWLDLHNAELTTYGGWSASLVGLKEMDEATQTVTFASEAAYPPGSFTHHKMVDGSSCYWKKGQTYIIWNVRKGMHRPGQWYLDRSAGKIVYWPQPDEDMSRIRAVVPTQTNVIMIRNGAHDITISGLTVTCALTDFGQQWSASSIITAGGVKNCRFSHLTIENTEGSGITLSGNNNTIERCTIRQMGKSGINAGGTGNTIQNNHIHGIGTIHYTFCCGISVGGADNLVCHNEVHDTAYTAVICMGRNNILELNRIYDVMHELNDGGCFYIGGTGNIIRKNVCLEGPDDKREWEGYFDRGENRFKWAYYMDENANNCTFEGNLALNTVLPTHMHMTKGCTFINNVFIDREIQKLSFPRSSGLTFEKNIIIADEIVFSHPYDAFISIKDNIIHSRLGAVTHENIMIYTPTNYLPVKEENGNVFAPPLFIDMENGIYGFKQDSPAHHMGIAPLDIATAGIIEE